MADIDDALRVLRGDVGEAAHKKPDPIKAFEGKVGRGEQPWFTSSAGINYTTQTDEVTGEFIIKGYQDVYAILEANQDLLTSNDGYSKTRDMKRVASIPTILRNKFINECGWDPCRPDLYEKEWKRLLNDIDYRKLRTAGGRV